MVAGFASAGHYVHHHANLHAAAARVLSVHAPGSIGRRYLEEVAQEVNMAGKLDLAKVKEIMLRQGPRSGVAVARTSNQRLVNANEGL